MTALTTKPSFNAGRVIVQWEGRWFDIPQTMLASLEAPRSATRTQFVEVAKAQREEAARYLEALARNHPHAAGIFRHAATNMREACLLVTSDAAFAAAPAEAAEPQRKIYLAPLQMIGGKTAELQVRFVSRDNIKDKPTEANPTPIRVLLVGDIERAQPTGTAFAAPQSASPEERDTKRGFMDGIDWQHHLEGDRKGASVYKSQEAAITGEKCLASGAGCGVVEVEVRLVRWVVEQDLNGEIRRAEKNAAKEGGPNGD